MKKSESIKEIATAFAKFQAEVADPHKTGVNTFFNGGSKYVQLDGLLDCVRPVLSKHGLSIMQEPSGDGQLITITTILMHNSGEWMEFAPLVLKPVKVDPQGAGSAITYGRRYALSSILGVAWDSDDDGNSASGKGDKKPQQTTTKANIPTNTQKANTTQATKPHGDPVKISDMQVKSLIAKYTKEGLTAEDFTGLIGWKYGVAEVKDLLIPQFAQMMNSLSIVWGEYVAEHSKAG